LIDAYTNVIVMIAEYTSARWKAGMVNTTEASRL
jgi:hypothetical protein